MPPTTLKHTPALLVLTLASLILFASGCRSTDGTPSPFIAGLTNAFSPSRIEAVAAYATAKTVRAELASRPDSREALAQASDALNALVAHEQWDLVALADALSATGIPLFTSEEGSFVVQGVLFFNDLFAGVSGKVTDQAHVRAVIIGAARGLSAALVPQARSPDGSNAFLQLRSEAVASRTKK